MKDMWIKWADRTPECVAGAEILAYWAPGTEAGGSGGLLELAYYNSPTRWHASASDESFTFKHEGPAGPVDVDRPTHWSPIERPAA